MGQLYGSVNELDNLNGSLSEIPTLNGSLSVPQITSYKAYDGPYEVIPKAYQDQILQTVDRIMLNNLVVTKVPYTETHNDSGITVYIAKETGNG